jgi:hypothetical protein
MALTDKNKCSTDQHVALNAEDGTKSQELSYSYENGMHTFSIPLKVDNSSTTRDCEQHKGIFKKEPIKAGKAPLHLVEAVSFELASTGFSGEGESVAQEFTLVPSGSKPFGTHDSVDQKTSDFIPISASLQDAISKYKPQEHRKKRKHKPTLETTKNSKGILNKSKSNCPSNSVTELGALYKRSKYLKTDANVKKEEAHIKTGNHVELASRLPGSKPDACARKDILELPCEWSQCSHEFSDLTPFMKHVANHINEVPISDGQKSISHGNHQGMQKQVRNRRRGRNAELSMHDVDIIDEDEEEEERLLEEPSNEVTLHYDDERVYCCLWRSCGYVTPSNDEIVRHVNFHTFHTKLKCHGASIWKETGIDACTIGTHQRNVIPELNEPLQCQWEGCFSSEPVSQRQSEKLDDHSNVCGTSTQKDHLGHQVPMTFSEPLKFYWHVAWHSEEMREGSKRRDEHHERSSKQKISCKWKDCTSKVGTVSKLKDHLRVHSQERAVACPVCGGLFTNRSKFYDHCKRQAPESSQIFKCSYCNKKFATERLLRDHMRAHVNHYKCPLCEMTCPVPSALAQHMAYRHFQVKSFGCDFEGCQYRAKTNADLRNHMRSHLPEDSHDAFYHCDEVDCEFKAKSKATVKQHKIDKHIVTGSDNGDIVATKNFSQYVCHMCDKAFARGAYLTQHFLRIHKFRWPSGHSRFRYKKDERTGQFHLQTIRFESAELHNNQTSHQPDDEEESDVLQEDTITNITARSTMNVPEHEESNSGSEDSSEESNYLTFGNIFANKAAPKMPNHADQYVIRNDSKATGSSGGLEAIIAAASVLDGKQLDS